MLPPPELVERLRAAYGYGCFACGPANPVGLHIDGFEVHGREVRASFQPRRQYRGMPDVLHGGVAATALDEIMVWAGILTQGAMSVTATLDLKFRNPSPLEDLLNLRGRIDERRGRRMRASGELLAEGTTVAEARGLLLVTEEIGKLAG